MNHSQIRKFILVNERPALFINTILFEKHLPGKHYFFNFTYPENTTSGKPEFKH